MASSSASSASAAPPLAQPDLISFDEPNQPRVSLGDGESRQIELLSDSAPVKKGCYTEWADKNPRKALALKYGLITLLALAVMGSLVGIGASGGFGSSSWLQHTALPAMKHVFQNFGHWVTGTAVPAVRKFLDMRPDLNVGQGLGYIAAPIVGAGVLTMLGIKFGPRIQAKCQRSLAGRKAAQQVEDAAPREEAPQSRGRSLFTRVKQLFSREKPKNVVIHV